MYHNNGQELEKYVTSLLQQLLEMNLIVYFIKSQKEIIHHLRQKKSWKYANTMSENIQTGMLDYSGVTKNGLPFLFECKDGTSAKLSPEQLELIERCETIDNIVSKVLTFDLLKDKKTRDRSLVLSYVNSRDINNLKELLCLEEK